MADLKNNLASQIPLIGCCGAYCGTCRALLDKTCKGCKLGYDDGERDIRAARCAMKRCCLIEKKLETCADSPEYGTARQSRVSLQGRDTSIRNTANRWNSSGNTGTRRFLNWQGHGKGRMGAWSGRNCFFTKSIAHMARVRSWRSGVTTFFTMPSHLRSWEDSMLLQ
jgi:hypothetical protein